MGADPGETIAMQPRVMVAVVGGEQARHGGMLDRIIDSHDWRAVPVGPVPPHGVLVRFPMRKRHDGTRESPVDGQKGGQEAESSPEGHRRES